jgi:glycosyltransferase involved in cell wall biosynthesis
LTKKLHILFLCSWYPSKVLPTNGDFIERHAEAVNLLHKISVVHIISDKSISKSKIEINTINNVHTCIGYITHTSNPFLKLIRYFNMYKRLLTKIGDFDLIHLNVLFPFGLLALHQKITKKKPFIISEHWTGYLKSQNHKISSFQKMLLKIITKNAVFVCPVSQELMMAMENFGLKGNYKPVGNVIDTTTFSQNLDKELLFTIIHISSLNDPQKNIFGMLRTAKKLEDKIDGFTWKFIGGLSENYDSLIDELAFEKASIQFIDHVPQKELAIQLQKAHIYVSFSNYETFGITLAEAVACGTFVISTNTGILNEASKKEYFSIIPINDEDALLNEILHQKNNPLNLDSKEMNTYIKELFSPKIIAEKFSDLYYKSLNSNS